MPLKPNAKMQDGFTTNNTRPERCQKCNRRSAFFLLNSSPILTVHVQSLRRSDILRRPALESVSSESRPTFRQNYIEVKAFEMRPLYESAAICLPSVALVEQVQKKKFAVSFLQLCVHDTTCS